MDKLLHIVTHDIPWPVNHGGFADLYCKIVALHSEGVIIHLHCYHKTGRKQEPHLEQFCASVYYYERSNDLSLKLPYIVSSRRSKELEKNISKDKHPVLLEGIHCTWLLYSDVLAGRKVIVRLHNIEHLYYGILGKQEKNLFRKFYYLLESRQLKKYEKAVAGKSTFLSVNKSDALVFSDLFKGKCEFLPVFLPWQVIVSKEGSGEYCLYHGNLSVNENNHVAKWLIESVFKNSKFKLVIAGLSPPEWLIKIADDESVELIINPGESKMQELINDAHINIIPSLNNTGVKLKLLNALFNGRHCLTNDAGAKGSGVEELCSFANTSAEFREKIQYLMNIPFTTDISSKRASMLQLYDNKTSAQKLMTYL